MENKFLNCFALTVSIIGALNWGLIGFFNLNLVASPFWKHELDFQNHLCSGRTLWSLSVFFLWNDS